MIVRIVKMEFDPDKLDDFLEMTEKVKEKIRSQEGCLYLEFLQAGNTVFTYSHWEDPKYLDQYKNSKLFKKVWTETKSYFGGKPLAWTTHRIHQLH